jgi:hypothetical protein
MEMGRDSQGHFFIHSVEALGLWLELEIVLGSSHRKIECLLIPIRSLL